MMRTALLYRAGPMPASVAIGSGNHDRHDPGHGQNRTVVRFHDLNLSYDIDVKVLYRRIRVAAAAADAVEVDSIIAATVAAIQHRGLSDHHRRVTS